MLAAASSALHCNPPGHHAQSMDEACCAGGIYQTSRGMHAPRCRSISDVVASDRRLTSLAETLRRAHFSGTLPPSLQARQPPARHHSYHVSCKLQNCATPIYLCRRPCHALVSPYNICIALQASRALVHLTAGAVAHLGVFKGMSFDELKQDVA